MSIIDVTISHDDYEKIKPTFKSYRDKAGMRYIFSSKAESDTFFTHEWIGPEDKLIIDFSVDQSKSTKDNPFITDANIHYTFTKKSTIAELVYVMLLQVNDKTTISEEKSSLKNEEDSKNILKSNFLSSIDNTYSKQFIEGTLRCIDSGILTQISTLWFIPFSSISHFETKDKIEEITQEADN